MARITKRRKAKEQADAWRKAGLEGRRVSFPELGMFRAYATIEEAQAAVDRAKNNGFTAYIVNPDNVY